MPSNGLCLSGGGIKGAFQVGVLSAMADHHPLPFDYCNGVSVGALNAAFIADRLAIGMDWRAALWELEDFWLNELSGPDSLVRFRGAINLATDIVTGNWRGLLDVSPLERIVKQRVQQTYSSADLPPAMPRFEVVAVELENGRAVPFGMTRPEWRDAVMASAMDPLTMPLRRFGGRTWTDGGVRDIAALQGAITAGCGALTTILCQPSQMPAWRPTGNLYQIATRILGIVTNEVLENDVHLMLGVKVYRPAAPLDVDITSFTRADIRRMYDLGRESYWNSPTYPEPEEGRQRPGPGTDAHSPGH